MAVGTAVLGIVAAGTVDAAAATVSGSFGKNTYKCSATVTGRSFKGTCTVHDGDYDGLGVYVQLKGVRNHIFDTKWVRATPDVPGGYPHTATFAVDFSTAAGTAGVDVWETRVCLKVIEADDPCGKIGKTPV